MESRVNAPNRNLVRSVLAEGGAIRPLMIKSTDSAGLGLCNPSVFVDNDEVWLILRNVNYTLYHCENEQTFNNRWGCLSYLNPEHDLHLRTTNFLCKMTPDLEIERYWKIDTSKFDKEPLWEFVGLEDARLVRWDGHLYGIGVRRDTTTNGQGRMELSELELADDMVKEIGRYRIEHPTDPKWYCEKNWMPVLDKPYHFVQWTNPAAVVKADLKTLKSSLAREVNEADKIEGMPFLRGSSQVISWRDYYICIVHDCDLLKNKSGQKDATYMHRFVIYDRNWNIVRLGGPFSFMGGEIEFCCGLAEWKGDLLITFGFQDNCAFILRVPKQMIPKVLGIDTLDWGQFSLIPSVRDLFESEIFSENIYERLFAVQEGDVVLDIGASVGPFIWSIKDKKAQRIIALEPDPKSLKTLRKNMLSIENVEVVGKGISPTDGRFVSNGLINIGPSCEYTWDGVPTEIDGIRLDSLVKEYGIDHVDFLKTDCEGGEYDLFNDENLDWVKSNVKHVAGEFHIYPHKGLKEKWVHFRDTYLKAFPNFSIYSMDGVEITKSVWDVWSDSFTDYYKAVMVYIDNSAKGKWQATKYPTLEITTAIPLHGCPMQCAFCPQDQLEASYAARLVLEPGERTLSFPNYVDLLKKVPKEVQITFAGYVEPFINSDCAAMIQHAHSTGHKVSLFTTGVGMSLRDLEQIRDIPFTGIQGGFVLHLPDVEGYFSHKSKGYIKLITAMKNARISNFRTMTMGTLAPNLREIFPDTVRPGMYSRAGNVKRDDLVQIGVKEVATTCGCQERLYHNVLLPNGDISLCCMDYGLEHILGNLYKQSYEEIIPVDGTSFRLCQSCENGVPA